VTAHAVAQLGDIDEITLGPIPCRPVRHHFGITSFGVNTWTGVAAGDRVINEHDEAGDREELYFVHSGRATFELAGETIDAPAGTFIFVPPGVRRTAFAEQPGTTILVVGGTPGQAWEVDGWELWAPVAPLYEEGRYAEAADRTRELVQANPMRPMLFYQLACCEALSGDTQGALAHLQAAVSMSSRMRMFAARDPDLDALRDQPGVRELLSPS
jgi:mannose-6-phosphate isomerase-like protein (cupin superfamily)